MRLLFTWRTFKRIDQKNFLNKNGCYMTNRPPSLEDLITSRRTTHNFIPNKIPEKSLIKEAIRIACWAPNHHLTQPWRFYLLGQETITSICELNRKIMKGTNEANIVAEKF